MLIYNPAQDCYHTIFRLLQILEENKGRAMSLEAIRILDFYLLFPAELAKIRFPQSLVSYKFAFKKQANPYNSLQNGKRVFHQLRALQIAALFSLASRNLVNQDLLRNHNLVQRTAQPLDAELAQAVRDRTLQMGNLVYFLVNELATMSLTGPDGLKDRSGLIEHRYDVTEPPLTS